MDSNAERLNGGGQSAIGRGLERLKKSVLSLKWYEWVMIVVMAAVAIYSVVTAHLGIDPITGKTQYNPIWLAYVNCVSALAGIMCIFLCAKASVANFSFGLINTVVYMVYLLYWSLPDQVAITNQAYWGTFALEALVYLPTGIISWAIWARHRDPVQDELTKAKKLSVKGNIIMAAIVIALTVGMHFLIVGIMQLGSDNIAGNGWEKIGNAYNIGNILGWIDSAVFAIGLTATVLQMTRYREQYVLWLIQDVIVVTQFGLPLIMGTTFDPVYFTKKSIYLIMAVIGLINWIKLNKQRNTANE